MTNATPAIARIGTRCPRGTSYAQWSNRWSSLLGNLQPFVTSGALRGVRYPATSDSGVHHCRREYEMVGLTPPAHIDYIVWSYNAPIAWHSERGWVITSRKYSVTTSRHTGLITRALIES